MDKTSAITLLDSYATKSCRSWKVSKSNKNYIVFCCDNPDCTWHIGFTLVDSAWVKISTWNESHSEDCLFDGPRGKASPFNRRQAAITAASRGKMSSSYTAFLCESETIDYDKMSFKEKRQI